MIYKLFIDDERFPADRYSDMTIARSYDSAIEYLTNFGCPVYISFDHDLGDKSKEGMDIVKWMVERDMDMKGEFIPDDFSFYVHSQNPIGAENIDRYLTNYLKERRIRKAGNIA